MKKKTAAERLVELLNDTIDILLAGEKLPDSPVEKVTTGHERRLYRRAADRLASGEQEPIFKNIYTRQQLEQVLRNTVTRDEGRMKIREQFFEKGFEIGEVIHEDPAGTRKAMEDFFRETRRQAKEQGPGSEADDRWRQLQFIERFARMCKTDNRRPNKQSGPQLAHDPTYRIPLVPAEILDAAPDGEKIIPIPADDGGERIHIRIGLGTSAWVGAFACGAKPMSTAFIMPDGKNIFVSAGGAGYIVDLESRTLVERTGTEVVGIMRDPLMTFFLINHNDTSLEAFGVATPLWKTGPLGAGGIRNIALCDDQVVGEARQASGAWTDFSIDVVTGAVRTAPAAAVRI